MGDTNRVEGKGMCSTYGWVFGTKILKTRVFSADFPKHRCASLKFVTMIKLGNFPPKLISKEDKNRTIYSI